MSFLLRAALVIGVLSWLALQRQGKALPGAAIVRGAETAFAAWDALPAPVREAASREAGAEVVRRVRGAPASADTLDDGDRKPAWRGP